MLLLFWHDNTDLPGSDDTSYIVTISDEGRAVYDTDAVTDNVTDYFVTTQNTRTEYTIHAQGVARP